MASVQTDKGFTVPSPLTDVEAWEAPIPAEGESQLIG